MQKTKILVVDDEKEIADLLELYLNSDGYQVCKAYNAIEGLEIMKKETIDLVLLDIMMPAMNGIEMCRKIRAVSNVPIIMISAKTQEIDKIVGLTVGAKDGVLTELTAPCGVCRQVMMEFCNPEEFQIILAMSPEEYQVYLLKELFPMGFGPANL